jgi:predicted permease
MPDWKNEIAKRLAALRLEPSREAAIVEELSEHIEQRYEDLLAAGIGEREALDFSLAELENPELIAASLPAADKLPKHDAGPMATPASGRPLEDFLRDLRHGFRALRKAPAFTFFAVLTLALGMGAGTTAFTLVNALLLHPLPVEEPNRLVSVYNAKSGSSQLPISYLDVLDLSGRNTTLSSLAGFSPPMVMTMGDKADTQRAFGELVTASFFETLGVKPAFGRFFLPEENRLPGSAPVAVLSYSAWQGKFGGALSVLGSTLILNGAPFTVIGVAPRGFIGISAVFGPDVWLPASMAEQVLPEQNRRALRDRGLPLFHGIGRLKPGVVRAQAASDLQNLAAALEREFPQTNDGRAVSVEPVDSELYAVSGGTKGIVFGSTLLLGIVGLVLLIACSNVANLLLARGAARHHELSIRLANGASRGRIVRQLLTESLLLGFLGGIAGLFLGYAGCQGLWSFRPPEVADNMVAPGIDLTVFLSVFLVSLATSFLFGLIPALRASKTEILVGLKEETRLTGFGHRSSIFAKSLLVFQVALSLISLITAALLLRGMERAYRIDAGFDIQHLALFLMNPEQAGYNPARTRDFYRDLPGRLASIGGVEHASWASSMPFWAAPTRTIFAPGRERKRQSSMDLTIANIVGLDYFETMRIPLVQGRSFNPHDDLDSAPVAVINEAAALRLWPRGDAIGQQVQFADDRVSRQVIGIAKNANYGTLGEKPLLCVYLPLKQNYVEGLTLYVKSRGEPNAILADVQREIRNAAPQVAVTDIRTGSKLLSQVLFGVRIGVSLLTFFGLLALALASVGLYGLMAYSVNRRRREIGVRMAMGARSSAILRLVLTQGMKLVAIGLGIGLAGALLVGRLLSRALFGLSSSDPVSLLSACGVLFLTALLACYFPARAASHVDPMSALRST